MGTSVNQGSPKTPGWSAVGRCYTDERISPQQTVVEIWRAAIAQNNQLQKQLLSSVVEKCVEIAATKPSIGEATRLTRDLNKLKENSVIGEFAKRTLIASTVSATNDSPASMLFRSLADYYVARDIPGYVGESFRFKTVSELKEFKQKLANITAKKVETLENSPAIAGKAWKQKVGLILEGLKRP